MTLAADDKTRLLDLLEKDIANRYIHCARCGVLHKFEITSENSPSYKFLGRCVGANTETLNGASMSALKKNLDSPPPSRFSAKYCLLGDWESAYGESPNLESPYVEPTSLCLIRRRQHANGWAHSWSAKVIDGELYIRSIATLAYFFGYEQLLRRVLDAAPTVICPHIYTHRPSLKNSGQGEYVVVYCLTSLYKRRLKALKDGHQEGIRSGIFQDSCWRCLTDCRVTIEKQAGTPAAWSVSITTYHNVQRTREGMCSVNATFPRGCPWYIHDWLQKLKGRDGSTRLDRWNKTERQLRTTWCWKGQERFRFKDEDGESIFAA